MLLLSTTNCCQKLRIYTLLSCISTCFSSLTLWILSRPNQNKFSILALELHISHIDKLLVKKNIPRNNVCINVIFFFLFDSINISADTKFGFTKVWVHSKWCDLKCVIYLVYAFSISLSVKQGWWYHRAYNTLQGWQYSNSCKVPAFWKGSSFSKSGILKIIPVPTQGAVFVIKVLPTMHFS